MALCSLKADMDRLAHAWDPGPWSGLPHTTGLLEGSNIQQMGTSQTYRNLGSSRGLAPRLRVSGRFPQALAPRPTQAQQVPGTLARAQRSPASSFSTLHPTPTRFNSAQDAPFLSAGNVSCLQAGQRTSALQSKCDLRPRAPAPAGSPWVLHSMRAFVESVRLTLLLCRLSSLTRH